MPHIFHDVDADNLTPLFNCIFRYITLLLIMNFLILYLSTICNVHVLKLLVLVLDKVYCVDNKGAPSVFSGFSVLAFTEPLSV